MKNNKDALRYCIYARKSQANEDRQKNSIESQLEEAMVLIKRDGLNLVETYVDERSAKKPNQRPQFLKMIEKIYDGEIDAIITWKADRLSRNPVDGGQILHLLQNNFLKKIVTPYSTYLPTDNHLSLTVELGMATQYSLDLSKNVKRGNKTKIAKGGWLCRAPVGYLNDKNTGMVIKDPDRFSLIRKAWDLMLTNSYSIQNICDILNDLGYLSSLRKNSGGSKMSLSTLHGIFNNTFYYGWMISGENKNWGNHEYMITESEFEKVQKILRSRGRKAITNYFFPYTGVVKCGECGCSITAEEKLKYKCPKCNQKHTAKKPKVCKCGYRMTVTDMADAKMYLYYRCTKKRGKCSQPYVRDSILDDQIEKIINSIEISPFLEKMVKKYIGRYNEERHERAKSDLSTFKRQYTQAEKRINGLIDMRANGEINAEKFAESMVKAELTLKEAKKRMNDSMDENAGWVAKVEEEFDFMIGISDRFKNGTLRDKQRIFRKIGSNFSLKDKKLAIQVKKKYFLLGKTIELAESTLELANMTKISGETLLMDSTNSEWWGFTRTP